MTSCHNAFEGDRCLDGILGGEKVRFLERFESAQSASESTSEGTEYMEVPSVDGSGVGAFLALDLDGELWFCAFPAGVDLVFVIAL